jgi:NAD(P)-dependent dehydrogenase (short-subunit alcohol dehydrogenase family)
MGGILAVTGGSQGIGAAVAKLAAARGYAVAFSYRAAHDQAREVVDAIKDAGGTAFAYQADAASESATEAFFAEIDRRLGPVTALVNNAGVTGPILRLDDVHDDMLREVMAVNINGCFLALRQAVLRMATDRGGAGGAIVNVSSRASELGGAGEWVHYAASKGAIDTFTTGAAKELAPRGIRVNAVNPGLIATDIHARAGRGERMETLLRAVPMGRLGTAEEVAKVILWLLSDEASYVTGARIPIDGGR